MRVQLQSPPTDRIRPILTAQPTWNGSFGTVPSESEIEAALVTRDLFIYCGHGSGEKYISVSC